MTKIICKSFGAAFNLHCPRCGGDNFKKNSYDSHVHMYHHCRKCGADVSAEPHMNCNTPCGTDIGIVVEQAYYDYPKVPK
jgi:hypothetical protein